MRAEPVTVTVLVEPSAVEALNSALARQREATGQRPWFDFDHAGKGPASAWPVRFFWEDGEGSGERRLKPAATAAGASASHSSAATGRAPGVYVEVEWSRAGAEAVQGKMYRAFSPTFFEERDAQGKSKEPARVIGAPLNMGALVNDPAFRKISPLFAGGASRTGEEAGKNFGEKKTNMNGETELAALQARLNTLEKENGELKASQNTAALEVKHTAALAAKDSEIAGLKTELEALKAASKAQLKTQADAAVKAAVARGAIAPKDEALQARWRALCEADAGSLELLNAMKGNPALTPVTAASAGAQGGTITTNGGEASAEQFVEAVKASFKETAATEPLAARQSKALDAAIAARPEAYTAWREAGGKGLVFS